MSADLQTLKNEFLDDLQFSETSCNKNKDCYKKKLSLECIAKKYLLITRYDKKKNNLLLDASVLQKYPNILKHFKEETFPRCQNLATTSNFDLNNNLAITVYEINKNCAQYKHIPSSFWNDLKTNILDVRINTLGNRNYQDSFFKRNYVYTRCIPNSLTYLFEEIENSLFSKILTIFELQQKNKLKSINSTKDPKILTEPFASTEDPKILTENFSSTEDPKNSTKNLTPTEDPKILTENFSSTEDPKNSTKNLTPTEDPKILTEPFASTEDPKIITENFIPTEDSFYKIEESLNTLPNISEESNNEFTTQSPYTDSNINITNKLQEAGIYNLFPNRSPPTLHIEDDILINQRLIDFNKTNCKVGMGASLLLYLVFLIIIFRTKVKSWKIVALFISAFVFLVGHGISGYFHQLN